MVVQRRTLEAFDRLALINSCDAASPGAAAYVQCSLPLLLEMHFETIGLTATSSFLYRSSTTSGLFFLVDIYKVKGHSF